MLLEIPFRETTEFEMMHCGQGAYYWIPERGYRFRIYYPLCYDQRDVCVYFIYRFCVIKQEFIFVVFEFSVSQPCFICSEVPSIKTY